MPSETENKLQRLGNFLDKHELDGVLLWQRNNFAWISCGGTNYIPNNTPYGVAAIYATRDMRLCIANTIEAPRMIAEEAGPRGIETVSYQWWNPADEKRLATELFGGKKIASDGSGMGLDMLPLPGDFSELRFSLLPEELERFRSLGRRASDALERACRSLKPGLSEHEVAGRMDHEIHAIGANPVVTLVSSDERLTSFRHPVPKPKQIQKYVMLVTCAEQNGLIANLTRFVHFGKLTAEQKRLQQAIVDIDAYVNTATQPGRTLAEVFADLQKAYADQDQEDQWQFHHQGGPCGYAGREAIANPSMSDWTVLDSQAYAWNPSIVGHKSEDTVVVTRKDGAELITSPGKDWPTLTGHGMNGQELPRADILVL